MRVFAWFSGSKWAGPSLSLSLFALIAGCNGVGEGSPCVSTRDCSSAALLCDLDRAECVQCLTDTDCFGVDEICAGRRCQHIVLCTSSRQCPGQVCDDVRGYCVDCVSNIDCPSTERCNGEGFCELAPPPCESDRQCSALGLVCDTTAGICAECVRDVDCGGGRTCSDERVCVAAGSCSPGITECASTSAVRTCGPTGVWGAAANCVPGSTCEGGACTDGSCFPGCGAGESCVAGNCRCGAGPICSAAERCVGGSCTPLGCVSCQAGEICSEGACSCGGGRACLSSEVCDEGSCRVAESCSPACSEDETCVDGDCIILACDSPCGLSPQCGCGSGQACDWSTATDARICRASGTAGAGAACSESVACAAGFTCLFGMCHRYCDSSTECGGGFGARCNLNWLADGGVPVPGTEICTTSCDPFTATGCQPGFGCDIYSSEEGVTTSCRYTGFAVPPIVLCDENSDCPANQTCLVESGECVAYCRVGLEECETGTCEPLAGFLSYGGFVMGYCPASGLPFP